MQRVMANMRELNYVFMRLATHRFHAMVEREWKPPVGRP